MPEVTRRRTGEFPRHLFSVLMGQRGGTQATDAVAAVRGRVKLTEHEVGEYPSGVERLVRILRFETIDTVGAGWLDRRRGLWFVTGAGRKACEELTDPGASCLLAPIA